MYPTTNAEDVAYIVANSGSRIVIAEDPTQLDKLLERRAEIPAVEKVVLIEGSGDGDWVISLEELEQLGKQLLADSPAAVTDRIDAIRPDQLATLIYTSGTTGKPKGVRLLQQSWTYTAAALDALGVLSEKDLNYLWLPLSHAFGGSCWRCRWRSGSPPSSTGGWTRSWRTLRSSSPRSWAPCPAFSRRCTAGSTR